MLLKCIQKHFTLKIHEQLFYYRTALKVILLSECIEIILAIKCIKSYFTTVVHCTFYSRKLHRKKIDCPKLWWASLSQYWFPAILISILLLHALLNPIQYLKVRSVLKIFKKFTIRRFPLELDTIIVSKRFVVSLNGRENLRFFFLYKTIFLVLVSFFKAARFILVLWNIGWGNKSLLWESDNLIVSHSYDKY